MPLINGKDVRRERQDLGLTQVALASLADVNPVTLNRFEKGMFRPSLAVQHKIQSILDSIQTLGQVFPIRVNLVEVEPLREAIENLRAGNFNVFKKINSDFTQKTRPTAIT